MADRTRVVLKAEGGDWHDAEVSINGQPTIVQALRYEVDPIDGARLTLTLSADAFDLDLETPADVTYTAVRDA